MNNEIKEMIKSVINENAISFKETTSKVLYGKIATKLQEEYKKTAKKMFETYKPLSEKEKEKQEAEHKKMKEDKEAIASKFGKYEGKEKSKKGNEK
jgi:hypothetical protein